MSNSNKIDFLVRSISKVSPRFVYAKNVPLITSFAKENFDTSSKEEIVESVKNSDRDESVTEKLTCKFVVDSANSLQRREEKENVTDEECKSSLQETISAPGISLDIVVNDPHSTEKCKTELYQKGEVNLVSDIKKNNVPAAKCKSSISDYLDVFRGAGTLLDETEKPGSHPLVSSVQKGIPKEKTKGERKNTCYLSEQAHDDVREAEYSSEIYIKGDGLQVCNDNTHAIRDHIIKIRQISYFTMAKLVCSMLNTTKHGVIYFGVNSNGTIRGLPISREQRDSFRCGVDNIMTAQITPRLLPSNYKIKFISVFRIQDIEQAVLSPDQNFYVVEVHIYPSPYTLYKLIGGDCYLRKNGDTVKATVCDVRLWIGSQEEKRYLPQIQVLRKVHKTIKELKFTRNSARSVENSFV